MHRICCLLIALISVSLSFAETQQGIVKTRGRMVDGQLVPGTRLSGATISLNFGNPLISDAQGSFSFDVPASKSFSLVSVKKQGYTLADPELTNRSFTYSSTNPFYVIMEDENQRQAEINAATRKVRKTLLAQLDKREEEIEALKAQNKLTEKEYQDQLQKLYDDQSKSEQLVQQMAERYATTDYDLLDDFNRQVQMYIEDGELQKADSMIRSKGDIAKRIADFHNIVAANRKEREKLEISEKGAVKTYGDLSHDLYRRHEIFLQSFMQDSALYCLKVRADLDTTRWEALEDYAKLCNYQNKFEECEKYNLICLRLYTNNNNLKGISTIQHNLGVLYAALKDYDKCEVYFSLSLEITEKLFNQNPDEYRTDLAATQEGMGAFYYLIGDDANCEKFYMLALENREKQYNQNPNGFNHNALVLSYLNLAMLYTDNKNFESAEKYIKLALENAEVLFEQNPDKYRETLQKTQLEYGNFYGDLKDYDNCEKYFLLALNNAEVLFEQNPDKYRCELSDNYYNLGKFYRILKDYANSEKYLILAIEKFEELYEQNPMIYRIELARVQLLLGKVYDSLKDFANGEKYMMSALENYDFLFNKHPEKYIRDLAAVQNSIGYLYFDNNDMVNCEKYFKLSMENRKIMFENDPETFKLEYTSVMNNLGSVYIILDRLDDATALIDTCISIDPTEIAFYDTKGEIFLMQGKNTEALQMWNKVLELSPDFLKQYPEGTNLSNGLKKLGLIK
ncbi:MAG: tetratricopeptide repeat protein [Bacteroidales bacterium]|nr:tetratricopeptide repeat protein [Candidatus Liminaster caballi]